MEFDYSEIGTNIRKARKKRGITQEELANVADISTQHLCRCLVAADKYIVPAFCKGCNDVT